MSACYRSVIIKQKGALLHQSETNNTCAEGINNMKDTKDILHRNHWIAASSIKTAVKALVFLTHNQDI